MARQTRLCEVTGCDNKHFSLGYCKKHYGRFYRHGDPLTLVERKRRRALLQKLKMESGCKDCGYNAHGAPLDFDHRPDETKLLNISQNLGRAWNLILAEVAKCDVRCANCHRIITEERRAGGM
jgi:hypothetical protein